MVLSNYVASLLTAYLGSFLKDINKDSVNVSILRGYVELRNVELSPAITEGNDFFRLRRGVIGYFKVAIPWHSLNKKSCSITIKDVSILLSTHKNGAQEVHKAQKHQKKLDQLDIEAASSSSLAEQGEATAAAEAGQESGSHNNNSSSSSSGGGGYFERLQQNIIANFSFIIENVVVRIEETTGCYEGKAAAAALSFRKIFCEPTNKDYQPHFANVTSGASIYRRIQYEALTAMLFHSDASHTPTTPESANLLSVGNFAEYCRCTEHGTPFLEPCGAEIRVVQTGATKPGAMPTFNVQYHSTLHETKISEHNVRAIRALIYGILGGQQRQLLEQRPHTRPADSMPGSTSEWWTYVLQEVRAQVRRRRRKSAFDWNQYVQRKQQCNDYYKLCLRKLSETPPTPSTKLVPSEAQKELENSLPLHDLLACRRVARREAKKEASVRLQDLPRDFREAPRASQPVHAEPSSTQPAIKTLGFNLVASVNWDVLRATVDGGVVAEMDGFDAAVSLGNDKLPSICVAPKRVHLGLGACKRVLSLSGRTPSEDCISLLHYMSADGGSRTIISGNELGVQVNADALGAVMALLSAYEPLIQSILASASPPPPPPKTVLSPNKMLSVASSMFSAIDTPPPEKPKMVEKKKHVVDFGLQQVTVSLYGICVVARNLRSRVDVDTPPTLSVEDLIVTVHGSALAYVHDLALRPGGQRLEEAIVFVQGNLRLEDNLEAVEYIKETLLAIKTRVLTVFPAPQKTDAEKAAEKKLKVPFSVEVLFPSIAFLGLELHTLHIGATLGDGWRIHMTSNGVTTSAGNCTEADLELVLWADGFLDTSPYAGNIVDDGIAFHFDVSNVCLDLDDKLCATAEQLLDLVMLAIFKEEDPRVFLRNTDQKKIPCLCGNVSLSYVTLRLPACRSMVPTDNPLRTLKLIAQDNDDVQVSLRRFRDKEMYVDVRLGDGLNGFLEDTVVSLGLFPLRRGSTATVKLHVMAPSPRDIPVFPYNRIVMDVAVADKAVVLHLPTVITLWDHFNTSGAGLWRMRNIGSRIHFSSRVSRGRVFPPRSPRSTRVAEIGLAARLTAEAPPNPNVPCFDGPYSSPLLPGDMSMAIRIDQCELYFMWGGDSVAPLFLHSNVAWCRIDISNHDCCTRVELSGVASLPHIACTTSVPADGTGNEEPNSQSSPVFSTPGQLPQSILERRRAALAMERDEDTHMLVKLIYTNDTRPPFNTGVADESMRVSLTGCVPRGVDGYVGTPSITAVLAPAELAAWCTLFTFFGKEDRKKAEGLPSNPPPPVPPASPPKPRRFLLDLQFAPATLYLPSFGAAVVLWHGARFTMEPGCNAFELPQMGLLVHRSLQAEPDRPSAWVDAGCGGSGGGHVARLRQLAEEGYVMIELGANAAASPSSAASPASPNCPASAPGLVWRSGPLAAAAAADADEDSGTSDRADKALIVQSLHVQLSEAVLVEVQNTKVLSRLVEVSQARAEQEGWLMDAIRCRRHALTLGDDATTRPVPPSSPSPLSPLAATAGPAELPLRIVVHRAELSVHWLSYCCERTMAALTCVVRNVSYSATDALQIGAGRIEIAPQETQTGRQRRRRHGLARPTRSAASPLHNADATAPTTAFPSSSSSSPTPALEGAKMVPRVLLPRLSVHSTRQASPLSCTEGQAVLVVSPVLLLLTTSTCTLLVELAQRLTRVLRHDNNSHSSGPTDTTAGTRARRRASSSASLPRRLQRPTHTAFYGHVPRLAEETALWKLGRRPHKDRNSPDMIVLPDPEPVSPLSPSNTSSAAPPPPLGGFRARGADGHAGSAAAAAAPSRPAQYVVVISDVELHWIALERSTDEAAFHTYVARHWTTRAVLVPTALSTSPRVAYSSSSRTRGVGPLPNMEEALRAALTSAHAITTALSSLFTITLKGVRWTSFVDGARCLAMSSCALVYPRQALRVLQVTDFELYLPTAASASINTAHAAASDKHAEDARGRPGGPPSGRPLTPPAPAAPSSPRPPPTTAAVPAEQLSLSVGSLALEPRVAVVVVFLTAYVDTPTRTVASAATTWHRAYSARREAAHPGWELRRVPSATSPLAASSSSLSLSFARLPAPTTRSAAHPHHQVGETLHLEHIVGQSWDVTDDLFLSRSGLVLCFSNAATNHLVVDLGGHTVTVDPAVLRPGRPAMERLLMVVDAHMTVSFTNGTFRLPATAWTARLRDAVADAEGGGVAAALVPFVALSEGSYLTCGESVRITFFADDEDSSSSASDTEETSSHAWRQTARDAEGPEASGPDTAHRWRRPRPRAGSVEASSALEPPQAWQAAPKRRRSTSTSSTGPTPAATAAVRHCHFYVGSLQVTQQDWGTARCLRAALRLEGWACLRGGQVLRDDIRAEELLVETFAIDTPSRATYTTVLAPTSLTVMSSDGAHHAVSIDALVMDVTREDVVQFAGIARACGELSRHVQDLSLTDAEKRFAQCLREALAWRQLSPAMMASSWAEEVDDDKDDDEDKTESGADAAPAKTATAAAAATRPATAARAVVGEEEENGGGGATSGGSPLSPYRQDSPESGARGGDATRLWRQDSSSLVTATAAANTSGASSVVLKSSLAVFIPLVELTLSDARYPLLRARAHGVLVRHTALPTNVSTLQLQNEDLGLDVYGQGRWDTILLPTASLDWSRTATTARHGSSVHTALRADGFQVQFSHMVLFKVRFAVAHALLFAKSFQSTFSATTPERGSEPAGDADGESTDEDEDEAALRAMAEAVARVPTPNTPLSTGATTQEPSPTMVKGGRARWVAKEGEEDAEATASDSAEDAYVSGVSTSSEPTPLPGRAAAARVTVVDVDAPDGDAGEEADELTGRTATSSLSPPPPLARAGFAFGSGGVPTATHRFHNAYNCTLFLLLATDADVPMMTPFSSMRPRGAASAGGGSGVTTQGNHEGPTTATVTESSMRARQQMDSEMRASTATALSRINRTSKASGATDAMTTTTTTATTANGTTAAQEEEEEGQILMIQPGGSVDVLIPYKRAHDLYISLLTSDCVQWSRGRQRFELNAQGRALDLTRTRVSATELQYGSATGLLLRDALVVLSCADEHGSGGGVDWESEELSGAGHTLLPQWQLSARSPPPVPAIVPTEESVAASAVSAAAAAAAASGKADGDGKAETSASPVTPSTTTRTTASAAASPVHAPQPPPPSLLLPSSMHGSAAASAGVGDAGGLLLVRIHAKRAIRNETGIPVLIRVRNDNEDEEDDRNSNSRRDDTETDEGGGVRRQHGGTSVKGSLSAGEAAASESGERGGAVLVASGQQLPLSTHCVRVVLSVQLESSHSGRRLTYQATLNTQRAQSGCFIQLDRVEEVAPAPQVSETAQDDNSNNNNNNGSMLFANRSSSSLVENVTFGCRDDQGLDMRPLVFFVVTRRIAESLSSFIYLYPRTTIVNHVGLPISVGLWQRDDRAGPQTVTDATLLEPWLPPSALSAAESRKLSEEQRAYRRLITLATHRHVPHRGALPVFQCDYTGGLCVALSFSQSTGDRIATEDVVEIIASLEDAVEHHPRLLSLRDSNGHTFYIQVAVLHRTIILSAAMWVYNYTEYPLLMTDSIVTRGLCAGQNRDTGIIPSQGAPFVLGVRLQDFTQVFLKVGLDARWSGGVAMDVGSKGVFESVQTTVGFTRSCNYAVQLPNAREGRPMTFVITPRWVIVNRTNKKLRLIFDCPGLTTAIRTSARLQKKLAKKQAQRAAEARAAGHGDGTTRPAITAPSSSAKAAEDAWKETFGALSSATSVVLAPGEHHVSCIGTITGNALTLREELAGMVPTVTSITDHAVQHKDLSKFYECQRTDPFVIDTPGQATFNLWAAPRPYMKRQAVLYGGQLDVYRPPNTFSATAIEAYDPFLADAVVTGRVAVSVQNADNVLAVVVQPVRATQIRVQNRCLHNVVMVRQQGSRRRNVIQPCRNHFFMWEDSKGERVLRLHMVGYKGMWFEVDFSKGDCQVTRCTTLRQGRDHEYYSPGKSQRGEEKNGWEDGEGDGSTVRRDVCAQGTRGHLPFHVRGFTSADQSGATILVTDAHVPLLSAGGLWRTSRVQAVFISYLSVAWVVEGLAPVALNGLPPPPPGASALSSRSRNSRMSSLTVENFTSTPTDLTPSAPPLGTAASASPSTAMAARGVLLNTIVLEGLRLEWLVTDDVNHVYAAVHQIQLVDEVAQQVFFYRARLALPVPPPPSAAATAVPLSSAMALPAAAPVAHVADDGDDSTEMSAHYGPAVSPRRGLSSLTAGHTTTTTTSTTASTAPTAPTTSGAALSRAGSRMHSPMMPQTRDDVLYPSHTSRHGASTKSAAAASHAGASAAVVVDAAGAAPRALTWTAATRHVAGAAKSALGTAWSLLKGSAVDGAMALGETHDVEMHVQLTQFADGMVRVTDLSVSLTPFVLVLSDTWIAQVLQEVRRTTATLTAAASVMRRSRQPPQPRAGGGTAEALLAMNAPNNSNNNSSFHVAMANGSFTGMAAMVASSPTTRNASFRSVASPLGGPASAASPAGANNSARAFPAAHTPVVVTESEFITQSEFIRHVVDDLIEGQASVTALAAAVAASGGLGPSPAAGDDGNANAVNRRRRLRARFKTSVQTQKGVRTADRRGGGGAGGGAGAGEDGEAGKTGGRAGAGGGAGGGGGGGTIQTYFRVEKMALSQVSIYITLRRHHPDPLRPLLGVYTIMLPNSLHQRAFHLSPFALQNSVETTASLRARLTQWAMHSLRQQWTKATKIGALIDMFAWGRRNLPLRRPPQALTLTRAQYLRSRQLRNGGDFPFLSSSSSSSSLTSSRSSSTSAGSEREAQRAREQGAAYRAKLRSIKQHRRPRGVRSNASGVTVVADDDVEEDSADDVTGTDVA